MLTNKNLNSTKLIHLKIFLLTKLRVMKKYTSAQNVVYNIKKKCLDYERNIDFLTICDKMLQFSINVDFKLFAGYIEMLENLIQSSFKGF